MLISPPRCWRKLPDCSPLHSIESWPDDMTAADWDGLKDGGRDPDTFVCVGCVRQAARPIPRDAYRMCWMNDAVDEMGEHDEQDLAHQASVIVQALAIIATKRTNGEMIEVPTDPDDDGADLDASADYVLTEDPATFAERANSIAGGRG